jgi:hypothetical protein
VIRVHHCILQETHSLSTHGLGGIRLLRCDGIGSGEHGGVSSSGVIQHAAHDLLQCLDVGRGEWAGVIR